jgi:hypothetical protein
VGKKHGVWFDLSSHLAIHTDVIRKFSWLIKSGDQTYKLDRFTSKGNEIIKHTISFETTNGYSVNISKETIVSPHDKDSAMTVDFSYNCFNHKTKYHLRYHSAHNNTYNPTSPWHDKPHRHEFDGKTKKIDIYSHDHRPPKDQNMKYNWQGVPVALNFLEHEEWPFISEFLDEVSGLN